MNRAGQFTIDLSSSSPRILNENATDFLMNTAPDIPPVAFLLRIELMSTQTFSFMWAVS